MITVRTRVWTQEGDRSSVKQERSRTEMKFRVKFPGKVFRKGLQHQDPRETEETSDIIDKSLSG